MAPSYSLQAAPAALPSADVLVVLLSADVLDAADSPLELLDRAFEGGLKKHLKALEYKADKGSALSLPTLGRGEFSHLVLSGLGKSAEVSPAALAEGVAGGVRAALAARPGHVAVLLPDGGPVEAGALGAALGAYRFDKYFHKNTRERATVKKVTVLSRGSVSAEEKKSFARGLRVADGVCLARDLVNEPPNVLYPETFVERAREVAKKNGLSIKVLDAEGLRKAGHLLHHAVGRGSRKPPYFIHLTYKPKKPEGRVAFVGKGLTFDSGGLCIKPMQGMADMKSDMAGGAAVLGLMEAITALDPRVEVHGIIGAAENMPDGDAYRPADVIGSLAGKGVEIINTDAEGRLVLADCLTYAARLEPDFIVDAATLTGATLVSLGAPYSAYFTDVEPIAQAMAGAAARAGESFWRMPLIEELAQQLKSDVTDLKHVGDRFGGAITAALFLREFTEGVPWMHWDIPGATYRERASGLHPKGGTGHAVLTFLELVRTHEREKIVSFSDTKSTKKKGAASVEDGDEAPKRAARGGKGAGPKSAPAKGASSKRSASSSVKKKARRA